MQLQLQRRFCVTDRASVHPIDRRLSPRPRTLTCNQNSHTQPLSAVCLHPRNSCNDMVYNSFTESGGIKGWVCLVSWPIADTLPTKWSHVNHKSGTDQEKSPAKDRLIKRQASERQWRYLVGEQRQRWIRLFKNSVVFIHFAKLVVNVGIPA